MLLQKGLVLCQRIMIWSNFLILICFKSIHLTVNSVLLHIYGQSRIPAEKEHKIYMKLVHKLSVSARSCMGT